MTIPNPIYLQEPLGDTWRLTLAFQDQNGVAESHAGSTWRGQVKTSKTAALGAAFATFTFDTTNQATGTVVASIAAATTATATVDTVYYWDLEETTSGGDVVTHMAGEVVWRQDVSRAT